MQSAYKKILLAVVLTLSFNQVDGFFTYKELGCTAAIIIPSTLIVRYYIEYQKKIGRDDKEITVEAQNALDLAKLAFQSDIDIADKVIPEITEDQRSTLETQLLKKIVSKYNRSFRWPFSLYEQSLKKTSAELKQHVTWIQERLVKSTNEQETESLHKIAQEILLFMSKLDKLREVLFNSTFYRIIQNLPCLHISWPWPA